MASYLPEIRIKYGWLIAEVTSAAMSEKFGNGERAGSFEQLSAVAAKYESWWRPYNDQVLEGLCEILQLGFAQNIIDVYVSPWFTPISDPMVIGPEFRSQESLLIVLAHELSHRLLTDNTATTKNDDLLRDWQRQFGTSHDRKTLVHIPVHAVLKKLYLDVLKRPDLLELDIETVKNNRPYADAWQYVQSSDYDEIVKGLLVDAESNTHGKKG